VKVIVVMGVSGCGKTSVGRLLAEETGAVFIEGDDHHAPENVRKMASGVALNDEDRLGWLQTLANLIREVRGPAVMACSALKEDYRKILGEACFVYLKGSPELLAERLADRRDHFMPPELLASQLETLEPPESGLILDIRESPGELVAQIRTHFGS